MFFVFLRFMKAEADCCEAAPEWSSVFRSKWLNVLLSVRVLLPKRKRRPATPTRLCPTKLPMTGSPDSPCRSLARLSPFQL